jgi:hypothetical protein
LSRVGPKTEGQSPKAKDQKGRFELWKHYLKTFATHPILKEGETLPRGSAGRNIMNTAITPGYFKTLQIPFIEGRDFDDRDRKGSQRTVIVRPWGFTESLPMR